MKRYVEYINAKGRLVRHRIYCTSEAALEKTLELLGVDRRAVIEEPPVAAKIGCQDRAGKKETGPTPGRSTAGGRDRVPSL